MNIQKMVATNARKAGAPHAIATLLAAKFQRYHKDKKVSDREPFDPRKAGEVSKASLQADKSKGELVRLVAKEKVAQVVEKTAGAIEQSAASRKGLAGIWAGATALFGACGYFVVDAILAIDKTYNGVGASMPVPERLKLSVAAVVGIFTAAAAFVATFLMHERREKIKDVAFDLRQVAKEAKNGSA